MSISRNYVKLEPLNRNYRLQSCCQARKNKWVMLTFSFLDSNLATTSSNLLFVPCSIAYGTLAYAKVLLYSIYSVSSLLLVASCSSIERSKLYLKNIYKLYSGQIFSICQLVCFLNFPNIW